jgi:hypothetical protein
LGEAGHHRFHLKNPLEGYRRQTFMMLDADIVAVNPSSVWRVLSQAGLLLKSNGKPSKKGTGFAQPLAANQHGARPNLAVLPAIERKDRALAQIAQRRVHPGGNAAIAR